MFTDIRAVRLNCLVKWFTFKGEIMSTLVAFIVGIVVGSLIGMFFVGLFVASHDRAAYQRGHPDSGLYEVQHEREVRDHGR